MRGTAAGGRAGTDCRGGPPGVFFRVPGRGVFLTGVNRGPGGLPAVFGGGGNRRARGNRGAVVAAGAGRSPAG